MKNFLLGLVDLILISTGLSFFIITTIYVEDNDERWFSRFALVIISIGFWYVGNKSDRKDKRC